MSQYTSIEGDMVDMICRRIYGDETGFVEQVLLANPGLVDFGPVLPAGVEITMPAIAAPFDVPAISLWE